MSGFSSVQSILQQLICVQDSSAFPLTVLGIPDSLTQQWPAQSSENSSEFHFLAILFLRGTGFPSYSCGSNSIFHLPISRIVSLLIAGNLQETRTIHKHLISVLHPPPPASCFCWLTQLICATSFFPADPLIYICLLELQKSMFRNTEEKNCVIYCRLTHNSQVWVWEWKNEATALPAIPFLCRLPNLWP